MPTAYAKLLFQPRRRLEEAWASTRVDQPDTFILGYPQGDAQETMPLLQWLDTPGNASAAR